MLTVEQCRKLLGKNCTLSDPELEALRDSLYKLADVAVETFLEQCEKEDRHPHRQVSPNGCSLCTPSNVGAGEANGRN